MTSFAMKSEQERNAERMSAKRSAERDIKARCDAAVKLINWPRRKACEADILLALQTYFPDSFTKPFSRLHVELVQEILHRAKYGGDQAIAAPRGEGKTTLATRTMLLCVIWGLLRFPVIGAATRRYAVNILDGIKYELEANEILRTDYPLACLPFAALERAAQRAAKQLYGGEYTEIEFGAEHVVMPKIPDSICSGSVMMMFSMDSAVRGINVNNQRPDFILIDDPETREAAHSITQRESIRETIRRDLAGLGGQDRRVSRLVLTTLQHPESVSAELTDPKKQPAFNGKRYRAVEQWPTNADLWAEYVAKRQHGMSEGEDITGRQAHQFYLDNREAMDAGAVMLNPHRFNPAELPDGTQTEASALQAAYNFIADNGMDAFLTEYQNDPPQDDALESGITSRLVATRISGLDHRELPTPCEALVAFMDVMDKVCYWTDSGWYGKAIGSFTDYGTIDVRSVPINPATGDRDRAALEMALMSVFHEWRELLLNKYKDATGATKLPDLCLIDSGDGQHMNAVYRFCREVGPPFYPSKGMKDGWRPPKKYKAAGDHWALVRQPDGTLLYEFEATYWKRTLHNRLLTPTFNEDNKRVDGSLALFVCPDVEQFRKDRREFSHQVTNEIWGSKKPGAKPGWIVRGKNHYLDCAAGNCLAANIVGVRLLEQLNRSRLPPAARPTAAQLAGRK